MKSLFFKLSLIAFASFLIVGCKKDDPALYDVAGTHWKVRIKWSNAADSSTFYPFFKSNGIGVETSSLGVPSGSAFTWTQSNNSVSWNYAGDPVLTGEFAADGKTMSGTGTLSPTLTAGWNAVKF